ncbi:MAG TPA: hypothetical protein VFQ23_15510 [Anaerolineales bacterium]|nr:hypothetical protein [Anaerolineales bacterium]
MRAGRFVISFLALTILLAVVGQAKAQSADVKYVPETGHNIRGDFLRFYNRAKDPRLVYGYPITEQIKSKDGKTVQYFQRARFELTSDGLGNPRILLTSIGQAAYQPGGQLNIHNSSGCQLFSSGYSICFTFLDFYKDNDGASQFGNPISPFEYRENLIVQYFERARFEWRADRPEGQRVVLTDLGRTYFDLIGEDPVHLKSAAPLDATINPVLSLRVRAFVQKSIVLGSGDQTVFVVVQSQTLQPVSNAAGKATINWPNGQTQDYYFNTNSAGIGSFKFTFTDQKQGELVPIDILVTYQGLVGKTATSFRIWY